jgi:hypothetical protein
MMRRKPTTSSPSPPSSPTTQPTMTTIPSRLARVTTTSPTWDIAHARSRSLYRAWYRAGSSLPFPHLSRLSRTVRVCRGNSRSLQSAELTRTIPQTAPEVTQLYALNIPAHAIRAKIREEFERNAAVTDKATVDVLLLKGYQDLQEVRTLSSSSERAELTSLSSSYRRSTAGRWTGVFPNRSYRSKTVLTFPLLQSRSPLVLEGGGLSLRFFRGVASPSASLRPV